MNRKNKRVISFLLAVCMVVSVMLGAAPVKAEAGVDDWREQRDQLDAEKKELEKKAEEAKKNADSAKEAKSLLDQRNAVLQEEIDMLQQEIETTSQRITENEAQEKAQYELFCKQVRQEEERGTVSYWSVLFKATSFADLLSRVDFINEIMEHDQRVINDLQTLRAQLTKDQADLEEQKSALSETQKELETEIAEANRLVNDLTATQEEYEAAVAEKEAASAEFTQKIEEWEAGQSNQSNQGSQTPEGPVDTSSRDAILGGIIWPSNSTRYITSLFGWRVHPIWGTSRFHSGLDIAVPYGTNVLAAQEGQVILADSGWNGGYGQCVIISHGHGVSTLYGHMSGIAVSEGQHVSRGQTIGYCGSSGNSTGPHIHFEVRLDGGVVDPMPYLDDNYIPYWDD